MVERMIYRFLIALIALSVVACDTDQQGSEVVVIDLNKADRADLAEAIKRLAAYQPRVIAINALFLELHNNEIDTILRDAIASNDNVILISSIEDESLTRTDTFFRNSAKDDGVVAFGVDDNDIINSYPPFINFEGQVLWSFPMSIIAAYDIELGERLLGELHSGSFYSIDFDTRIDTLAHLGAINQHNLSRLKNKIVLFGDLQSPDDTFLTDNGDMPTTIIIGHILNNMLQNKFEISSKIDRPTPKIKI
jgi:hypothetical protein